MVETEAWLAWAWRIQWGETFLFQAGPRGGGIDDAADLGDVERAPAFAAAENGLHHRGFPFQPK